MALRAAGYTHRDNPLVVDRPWFRRSHVEMAPELVLQRGDTVRWREGYYLVPGRVIAASPACAWPDGRPAVARVLLVTGQQVLAFADELERVS